MAAKFRQFKATIDGTNYYFLGTVNSEGNDPHESIQAQTGVSLSTATNSRRTPNYKVEELLRTGHLERFVVTYRKNSKLHTAHILVARDKAQTFHDEMTQTRVTLNGGDVVDAIRKRTATFS